MQNIEVPATRENPLTGLHQIVNKTCLDANARYNFYDGIAAERKVGKMGIRFCANQSSRRKMA
jgi:hypothetical protein